MMIKLKNGTKIPEICYFCGYTNITEKKFDGDERTCRRYAPRILHGSGYGWSDQKFPIVEDTDWCGEFKLIKLTEDEFNDWLTDYLGKQRKEHYSSKDDK